MAIPTESRNPLASIDSQLPASAGVARREFLRFVATSPLLLSGASAAAVAQLLGVAGRAEAEGPERKLLRAATDAIDVFDFEPVAKRNLLPAHYTYLSMGIQDEFTLQANRQAFGEVQSTLR